MGMRVGDGMGGGMREGRGGMEEERERPWALLDWTAAVRAGLALSPSVSGCLLSAAAVCCCCCRCCCCPLLDGAVGQPGG